MYHVVMHLAGWRQLNTRLAPLTLLPQDRARVLLLLFLFIMVIIIMIISLTLYMVMHTYAYNYIHTYMYIYLCYVVASHCTAKCTLVIPRRGISAITQTSFGFSKQQQWLLRGLWGVSCCSPVVCKRKCSGCASKVTRQVPCSSILACAHTSRYLYMFIHMQKSMRRPCDMAQKFMFGETMVTFRIIMVKRW